MSRLKSWRSSFLIHIDIFCRLIHSYHQIDRLLVESLPTLSLVNLIFFRESCYHLLISTRTQTSLALTTSLIFSLLKLLRRVSEGKASSMHLILKKRERRSEAWWVDEMQEFGYSRSGKLKDRIYRKRVSKLVSRSKIAWLSETIQEL